MQWGCLKIEKDRWQLLQEEKKRTTSQSLFMEAYGLEVEEELSTVDEVESRKKLDEQMRKLQKELRDIEKLSCVPKEFQEDLKSNLQQQLREVEQRWHDLMPEHQKVQKRSQNIQIIHDK